MQKIHTAIIPIDVAIGSGTKFAATAAQLNKAPAKSYEEILNNAFSDAKILVSLFIANGKVTKRNSIGHTRFLQARALLRAAGLWANGTIKKGLRQRHYTVLLDDAVNDCKTDPSKYIMHLPPSHSRLSYVRKILND